MLVFALYTQLRGYESRIMENFSDIGDFNRKFYGALRNSLLNYIPILLVLMLLNWAVEAFKWKLVMRKVTPIAFVRAFQAVWTGVTLGLFTPNRIGEFGGRILYIPKKSRLQGIVTSLVNSYSQIVAIFFAGLICLPVFFHDKLNYNGFPLLVFSTVSGIALLLIILSYYNMNLLVVLFGRIRFFRKIEPYVEILDTFSVAEYTLYLLLSLLRYTIFAAQYLIFLRMFGMPAGISQGLIAIGVVYLTQTIIPTFAVIELLTRGNIAVFFFKYYGISGFVSLAASSSMWLLNLILPAILGYFFIIRFNFFKNGNT